MKSDFSLFSDEEQIIAQGKALLAADAETVPADSFRVLLSDYAKLYRQSTRLVKMGDRMQGQLNSLNEQLTKSEEKYRRLFEGGVQGVYRSTLEGRLLDINPAMARIFGYDSAEEMLIMVRDMGKGLFLSRDHYNAFVVVLRQQGVLKDHPLELRRRNGDMVHVEVHAQDLYSDSEETHVVEALVVDVTDKQRMLKELEALARTDCLTRIWNRRYFFELGQREVARARRNGSPLTLIFFDVDHFKRINDTHGHDAGDSVLKEIAVLVREHLRQLDIFGRMGGEEFAVLLPETDLDRAEQVAEKLRQAIAHHDVVLGQTRINCTASFGLALFENESEGLDCLLCAADQAMYSAKSNGRNSIHTSTQIK